MQKPSIVEELSFQQILAVKKAKLAELDPKDANNLTDSDPAIQLLEVTSYSEGLMRARINSCVLACTVQYASGSDLDNLAAFYGITRKLISPEDKEAVPPQPAVYESDEELRKRVLEAPLGFSVAGPRSSYIYHGKLASDKVKDISAESTTPGEIIITVLSYDDNGLPDDSLISIVSQKLNDEDIRPLGDKVTVNKANITLFEINLELVLTDPNDPNSELIISTIKQNIQNYVNSMHVLGGEVALSGIYAAAHVPNIVKEITLISPVQNIKTSLFAAPYCTNIIVNKANFNNIDTSVIEVK